MRVILVDDEEELVVTMAERLDLRGIQANWATTAAQALRMVAETPYDLAVLDMKMPRTTGIEIRAQMRVIRPEMGFIFLTGHGSGDDFRVGREAAGADNYLAKPLDLDVLVARIKATVGRQGGEA